MGGWGCAGSPTAALLKSPATLLVPGGSTVRVLLLDEPGPIAIEDADTGAVTTVTIWKAGDGLRLTGGPEDVAANVMRSHPGSIARIVIA